MSRLATWLGRAPEKVLYAFFAGALAWAAHVTVQLVAFDGRLGRLEAAVEEIHEYLIPHVRRATQGEQHANR